MIQIAIEASEASLVALKRLGPKLDRNYLNALGLPGVYVADLDAWKVEQVADHFIRLLKGELQWDLWSSPLLPLLPVDASDASHDALEPAEIKPTRKNPPNDRRTA